MENGFFNSVHSRVLGALVLLMFIIALGSYAALNFEKVEFLNPTPATISVSGEGEVLAVPDIGQFSFSVNAEADTAAAAQEESGTKINAILAYLVEQGIAEKDVKTENYNLYPRYRYEERLCIGNSYCPPGEQIADGFEVSQSVSVKVRDTKAAGAIISGVGERGATNISSLNFTVDDVDTLLADARAKAIIDAQEKAQLLAKQLGVRIVRLVGFHEDNGYYNYDAYAMKTMSPVMAESADFAGAEMPVGEQQTTAQVTVIYEVR